MDLKFLELFFQFLDSVKLTRHGQQIIRQKITSHFERKLIDAYQWARSGIRLVPERARAFPIEKALAKLGHFPIRKSVKEAWFLSPFRPEDQASFKVSKELNRWYDHGAGKGGNVIDLVCIINGSSVKETLDWLENGHISLHRKQGQCQ